MSPHHEQNLAAALRLAGAAVPVFPANIFQESDSWKKKPCIAGWQMNASTDEALIRGWWAQFPDAVPAIPCGAANLVVIDVDRHGQADGVANFETLLCGRELPACPVTATAGGGLHYIFSQPDPENRLGNASGALPDGIDVRGDGGFIIAPGAVRPDGASYDGVDGAPDLAEAFRAASIPRLPAYLADLIRSKRTGNTADEQPSAPTEGERAYARQALKGMAEELASAIRGERNTKLHAISYRMGHLIGSRWIDKDVVTDCLIDATRSCGLLAEDGRDAVIATAESGLDAGALQPHPPLAGLTHRHARGTSEHVVKFLGSADSPKARWLAKGIIPEASIGLMLGASGDGKSFCCVKLAASVAVGTPFFGNAIRNPGGVIYVCAEGLSSVEQRFQAEVAGPIRTRNGETVDAATIPIATLSNVCNLNEEEGLERLIGTILATVEQMKERYGISLRLVIIDTLLAAFGIDDWNNAAHAQLAMSALQRIRDATGAVVMGVHHLGKDRSKGATGSFAFTASADFILSTFKKADEFGRVTERALILTKSRQGETAWACEFCLRPIEIGIDEYGDPILCAFVEPILDGFSHGPARPAKPKKDSGAVRAFKQAFAETVMSEGEAIKCDDGEFRGISKDEVRRNFSGLYGGSEEAKRKAFDRALDSAVEKSIVKVRWKDGRDWFCEPTAVEERESETDAA